MSSVGCLGRLVGEGAEGAMGAKGEYWEEHPVSGGKSAKPLREYQNFELGKVTNDYGRNVPGDFMSKFPADFKKALKHSGLPTDANGKTLLFNVRIIHYEKADMSDNVLGPMEQVVASVELVDKDTGAVVASGNAIGRTGKTVGLGAGAKAEGLSKALIKWASDYSK